MYEVDLNEDEQGRLCSVCKGRVAVGRSYPLPPSPDSYFIVCATCYEDGEKRLKELEEQGVVF